MIDDDDFDFTKPPADKTDNAATPSPGARAAAPAVQPARSKVYDPVVTAKLFKAFGKPETIKAGAIFFAEHDKAEKGSLFKSATLNQMYFLEQGEVILTAAGRTLDTIRPGEIFGEMAVVNDSPRSATATAKTDCVALALDAQQFQTAIQRMPEFALMLMSVMFDRLRLVAARLAARKARAEDRAREGSLFDKRMLDELLLKLDNPTRVRVPAEKVIMREGEAGMTMYVVLSGRMGISVRGTLVESVGEGGTFGEMALVDQSPRTASAFAQVDSELLAINRNVLMTLVKEHPGFSAALLRAVADRLRYMNSLLAG
ncbi:MAG: cyclic nucleotide-binding domain-containing protein [Burkholderiales bacterium]|nr:cyclic nucleotide-binding domain-containing protein [Burkholderiales bacterium]